jgi:hypothetical protein
MKSLLQLFICILVLYSGVAFGQEGGGGSGDPVAKLGIFAVFGTPILIVLILCFFDTRNKALMFGTIDKAIESGTEIPASVLEAIEKPAKQVSSLRAGLVWCGLGLGVLVAWTQFRDFSEASLGFIPLFIGIAYLISARLEPDVVANG